MNSVFSISTLICVLAALRSVVLVWRTRDWRLVFLPLMLALMALQSILPASAEIQPLMLQVSILTVVLAMFLSFFVRRDVQRLGGTSLRLMLGSNHLLRRDQSPVWLRLFGSSAFAL